MRYTAIFAGMLFAIGTASAATVPHVDMSKPHNQPPYPSAAQVNGEEGTVELSVLVSPRGRVRNVRVVKTSGYADLDNAAVEGVMGWRFVAAVEGSDTVSAWTTVRIVYQLPRAPAPPK